jgi:hypothetical protein
MAGIERICRRSNAPPGRAFRILHGPLGILH